MGLKTSLVPSATPPGSEITPIPGHPGLPCSAFMEAAVTTNGQQRALKFSTAGLPRVGQGWPRSNPVSLPPAPSHLDDLLCLSLPICIVGIPTLATLSRATSVGTLDTKHGKRYCSLRENPTQVCVWDILSPIMPTQPRHAYSLWRWPL